MNCKKISAGICLLLALTLCAACTKEADTDSKKVTDSAATTAAVATTAPVQADIAGTDTETTQESTNAPQETKPGNSSAADTASGKDTSGVINASLTWKLSGGSLLIEGGGAMPDFSAERLAPWDNQKTTVKSVKISDNINNIGGASFAGCTALTDVTISRTVFIIGEGAFSDCTALTKIEIPDCLGKLSEKAFSGCSALASLTLPTNIQTVPAGLCKDCTALTKIDIPRTVTAIGEEAFAGTGITDIKIHKDCKVADNAVPAGCSITYYD